MLTYAIGFVQDVQLICFAFVLGAMALLDRRNLALRWLALAYGAGLAGAILDFGYGHFPAWMSIGLYIEAAPLGYWCLNASITHLMRRGRSTLWVSGALLAAAAPFILWWSSHAKIDAASTLADACLAVQTAISTWLLATTHDAEVRWPRRVMATFLAGYSAIEFLRVAVFVHTGQMPPVAAPWLETASGLVYVVSCSVLPLAYIWLMNVRLHAHLLRQSRLDPLTEIINRRGLEQAFAAELQRARKNHAEIAAVLMDVDGFKQLNDTWGHPEGDAVLRQTASFLASLLRPGETLGRLGGEEFLFLLPRCDADSARVRAESFRRRLSEQRFRVGAGELRLTASFGVAATSGRAAADWSSLLREADIALYAAKRAGRNRVEVYALEAGALEPELRLR